MTELMNKLMLAGTALAEEAAGTAAIVETPGEVLGRMQHL